MKITTKYVDVTPDPDDKPSKQKPSKRPSSPAKPLKYFRTYEIFLAALFAVFIGFTVFSFNQKQKQVENTAALGVVYSIAKPDWQTGTVYVVTDIAEFRARPFFNLAKGDKLVLKRFYSGNHQLCILNKNKCISITENDASAIRQ